MRPLNLIITRLLVAAAVVAAAALLAAPASGQQGQGGGASLSCTASLITSFTPCLNFLTGSTNGGGGSAPTQDCCRSLGELMSASTGCACLILTGNVPLGGVNRTLAVALPKACNSAAVPLQCQDTSSAQIPAPASPVADDVPSSATPEVEPTGAAPVSQGQTRPIVLPSSGRRASADAPATTAAAAFVLLLAVVGDTLLV